MSWDASAFTRASELRSLAHEVITEHTGLKEWDLDPEMKINDLPCEGCNSTLEGEAAGQLDVDLERRLDLHMDRSPETIGDIYDWIDNAAQAEVEVL